LAARAHGRATSRNAVRFLPHVLDALPFAVTSIQVDGGGEFRGAFGCACRQRGIALYVLPPKSPKWNGCVERAHRSLREEFHGWHRHEWDLQTQNQALDAFQQHYCHYRPHGGKNRNWMTPMAYYQPLAEAA